LDLRSVTDVTNHNGRIEAGAADSSERFLKPLARPAAADDDSPTSRKIDSKALADAARRASDQHHTIFKFHG